MQIEATPKGPHLNQSTFDHCRGCCQHPLQPKFNPNFEETQNVANISNCPVVISGGVSSINDIKKAKNLNNIEGVIVGKAIYDGEIKLDELAKEIDA